MRVQQPYKTVRDSRTCMTDLVFPPDTNHHKLTSRAYLTFIALDEEGKPAPVPLVIPETEEEKRQYEHAKERYERRKARRKEIE